MSVDCDHKNPIIEKRLEAIYSLHTKNNVFRLDKGPYINLLAALGNPHQSLPPTIHLAGTNGKGSTLSFLKSIYETAGLRVHTYTSPHLIQFNERIVLGGEQVTDEQLLTYFDMVDNANNGNSITFFEYTTALTFKAFADHPADILLLETGLGGRLDCTNVIQDPLATIITSIGYDHTEWLGTDIKNIAYEKAGIMKHNAPCFVSPQPHDVQDVFDQKAKEFNCSIHHIERNTDLPPLGLIGDHQQDNASTAVKVVQTLHPDISDEKIAEGLKNTKWPARMEKISDTPEVWFDCGHNAEGAQTIAKQLKQWKEDRPDYKINLILGLAADKNPNEFLTPIVPYIDNLTCVDLPNARNPQSAIDLRNKIDIWKHEIECISEMKQNSFPSKTITLICGSLYLYSTIKKLIDF